jgi:hypothetical protein
VRPGEGGAAAHQGIDVGGFYHRVAQGGDGIKALIVGKEKEYIGSGSHG